MSTDWDKLKVAAIAVGSMIVAGIVMGSIHYYHSRRRTEPPDPPETPQDELEKLTTELSKIVEETEQLKAISTNQILELEKKFELVSEDLKRKESRTAEMERKLNAFSEKYHAVLEEKRIRDSGETEIANQLEKLHHMYEEVKSKLISEEKKWNDIERKLDSIGKNIPESEKSEFPEFSEFSEKYSNSGKFTNLLSPEKGESQLFPQGFGHPLITSNPPSPIPLADSQLLKEVNWEKRTKIAEEIVETERSYVHSLSLMLEIFYKSFSTLASQSDGCISTSDVKTIFSCAEIILNYNRELLKDLENVIQKWDPKTSKLGAIFTNLSFFLKTYITYVSNYSMALRTLEKCKKDEQFAEFLMEIECDGRLKNMPLTGFLIMPVQRIPRYLLLLKELLKCTPHDHVDYEDLVRAHEKIATIALDVNEAERNAENLNTIYLIQTILEGQVETIVEPHRRLVKHGKVYFWDRSKKKEAYLILFNDMIILAKQK